MIAILSILIILAAILLILVVLVQNSKGGGLAANFASSNQVLGVRKTTDFLEKATWSLAVAMVVLALFYNVAIHSTRAEESRSIIQEKIDKADFAPQGLPVLPAPDEE
ncbi:MAG: preprotein translocase subunit SecG [Flavobacteriales bacterium]